MAERGGREERERADSDGALTHPSVPPCPAGGAPGLAGAGGTGVGEVEIRWGWGWKRGSCIWLNLQRLKDRVVDGAGVSANRAVEAVCPPREIILVPP